MSSPTCWYHIVAISEYARPVSSNAAFRFWESPHPSDSKDFFSSAIPADTLLYSFLKSKIIENSRVSYDYFNYVLSQWNRYSIRKVN